MCGRIAGFRRVHFAGAQSGLILRVSQKLFQQADFCFQAVFQRKEVVGNPGKCFGFGFIDRFQQHSGFAALTKGKRDLPKVLFLKGLITQIQGRPDAVIIHICRNAPYPDLIPFGESLLPDLADQVIAFQVGAQGAFGYPKV